MSFMSLRESLARSKIKWRKRLYIGSDDVSPAAPVLDVSALLSGTLVDSASSETTQRLPIATHFDPKCPGKSSTVWPGLKSLLEALESTTGAFGPLKSAISELHRCVDIYEGAFEERQDYQEVGKKLEALLDDLAKHVGNPMGSLMTSCMRRLCGDLEAEVRILENKLARNTAAGRRLLRSMEEIDDVMGCYRRIQSHLERLTMNANLTLLDANMRMLKAIDEQSIEARLAGMSPSMSARYDSTEKDDIGRGGCTLGTRVPQIDLLLEWARDPESGRACWMNGMAGTGKTTIAYTVCTALDEACKLGASFFCSRVIPECRQAKYIIPSISYQLARFSLPFRCSLAKVLESDPDAHTRGLNVQYEKLIVEPLLQVQASLPPDLIVVIDALDECENENTMGQILDLLLSPKLTLPIRFLVSSRPEMEIVRRMRGRVDEQGDVRLVLHDLAADAVKADIEAYMKHELKHIPLTNAQWSGLIDRCGVLFIYASTTCRYLEQAYNMDALEEAVEAIVGSTAALMEDGDETAIDELYHTILTAAFNRPATSQANKRRIRVLLETVICAVEPLTLDSLASLLGLGSTKQAGNLLQPLRSVLNIVESTGLVTTLHASFPDFMFSSARSQSFHCKREVRHAALAKACLQVINADQPKFNICGLSSSYNLDIDIEDLERRVKQAISPSLAYACRYWSTHLSLGEHWEESVDSVNDFLSAKLLFWMEVMSLTQRMRHGISIIRDVERWCSERAVPDELTMFAHDAWQFVSIYAGNPVSRSTPHIYVSMLPFWPPFRPISKAYMQRTTGLIQPTGTAIDLRRLSLVATWSIYGHPVDSMRLSPDGTRIVAAAGGVIHVLDTSTGDTLFNLTVEDLVCSVAIPADGNHIIFGCADSSIYLWDTRTGGEAIELLPGRGSTLPFIAFSSDSSSVAIGLDEVIHIHSLQGGGGLNHGPLKGHTDRVYSLTFSPNGLYLASGSVDGTICVWDTQAGHMIGTPFEGHTDRVCAVAFSPDGLHLASASDDDTIRVWDPRTGHTLLGPLKGHSNGIFAIAYSSTGAFIASGSRDGTIRMYDAQTGQIVIGPLIGHTEDIVSLNFSSDDTRLFSFSCERAIRVWDIKDRVAPKSLLQAPFLSTHFQSVRYSHSGLHLASGSEDGTIHIWDIGTGEVILGPLYGHTKSVCSVDYSSNGAYIVSASEDKTLRVWGAFSGDDLHGPLAGHDDAVRCVRFSPDSSLIVSGSLDGTVRIWNVGSGQLVISTPLEGNFDHIYSVGFSPDGKLVASGDRSGMIRVLDRQSGETVLGPLQGHKEVVASVELSLNGSRILSSSWDGSVRMWDAQTGQQLLVCEDNPGESGMEFSAAFSPDNCFIVSCSLYQDVRVWDAQSGQLILGPLKGHTGHANCVQFSTDGSQVVSCSDDRTIRLWDLSSYRNETQENPTSDDDEAEDLSANENTGPDAWVLDSDGWVVDQQRRRLIWVPSDLQNLLQSSSASVFSHQGNFTLKFDGALIGKQWIGCYQP